MLVVRFRAVVCGLVTLLSSRKARKPSCACDASLRARERIQARYWSVDCCSPVHTCTEHYSQLMSISRNSCWLYLLLEETLLTRPAASHSLHHSTSSLTATTITLAPPITVYQCATLWGMYSRLHDHSVCLKMSDQPCQLFSQRCYGKTLSSEYYVSLSQISRTPDLSSLWRQAESDRTSVAFVTVCFTNTSSTKYCKDIWGIIFYMVL